MNKEKRKQGMRFLNLVQDLFSLKERKPLFCFAWKLWHLIGAILFLLCLGIAGVFFATKHFQEKTLVDQRMASRWSKENDYAQISLFFPYGTKVDDTELQRVSHQIQASFEEISMFPQNPSQRLFIDTCYELGKVTIQKDHTYEDVEVMGVSGEFFRFHEMEFVSGGPIPNYLAATEYIVIDETTAWKLFGAIHVDGMEVRIGGVPHTIAGVMKTPADDLSVAGGAKKAIAYVTTETLKQYGQAEYTLGYELLMPEVYEGFALNTLKTAFSSYEESGVWVDNTKRFQGKHLFEIFKERNSRMMQTKPMIYPYWENVARFYENRFMKMSLWCLILLVIAGIIAVLELISIWRMRNFHRQDLIDGFIHLGENIRKKRLEKIANKKRSEGL